MFNSKFNSLLICFLVLNAIFLSKVNADVSSCYVGLAINGEKKVVKKSCPADQNYACGKGVAKTEGNTVATYSCADKQSCDSTPPEGVSIVGK